MDYKTLRTSSDHFAVCVDACLYSDSDNSDTAKLVGIHKASTPFAYQPYNG